MIQVHSNPDESLDQAHGTVASENVAVNPAQQIKN
jgi:hypothetical protein